jgi:restriction endonuclease S subunit
MGGTGTNITNLNQGRLTSLGVPFPPLRERKTLEEKLERISEACRHLESIYQQSSTHSTH